VQRATVLKLFVLAGGAGLAFAAFRAFGSQADPEASAVESSVLDVFSSEDVGDVNADTNLRAFLLMIRKAEGTAGPDGYRTIFGGQLFESFADHPRVKVPFTQTDGETNYSTAAGAYQFTVRTWDDLAAKLGLPDFSPENQDKGAGELIRERGAFDDVKAGRFDDAIAKIATIWASLPGSPYPQPHRSRDYVLAAYQSAGGSLA